MFAVISYSFDDDASFPSVDADVVVILFIVFDTVMTR